MAKKFSDYTIDGKPVPSVTTILGAAISKPALNYWYLKCGKEGNNPSEILKDASEFGDFIHKAIDSTLRGQTLSLSGLPQTILNNFKQVTKDWKWVGGEFRVFNREHMYGGTVDQVFIINGEPTLVDIKTSSGVYSEMKLQLSGYKNGVPEKDPEFIDAYKNIKRCLILHVDKKTGGVEVLDRTPNEKDFEAFLAARRLYDWIRENKD